MQWVFPGPHSGRSLMRRQGAIDGRKPLVVESSDRTADLLARYRLGLIDHDLRGFSQAVPGIRFDGDSEQRRFAELACERQDRDGRVLVEEIGLDYQGWPPFPVIA